MLKVRKAKERGHTRWEWLESYHSFSFGEYYDPKHIHFRDLRVINEDFVAPEEGFPLHPHENMEIITYVIEGTLEHQDTLGNKTQIKPGEIQRMSAGSGIEHSEYNPSKTEQVHLLQIWILPKEKNIVPSYAQKSFLKQEQEKKLLLAANVESETTISLNQDVKIYRFKLKETEQENFEIQINHHLWLQMIKGELEVGEIILKSGDALSVSQEDFVKLKASKESEFLVFELK